MLKKLSIENYALIEHLELELSPALNIITGETGAGKSILLGALGLILGNRSDTSVLKDTSRNCVTEGTFDIEGYGLEPFFDEYDIDFERHTVIRRIITPAGKSRAYINDIPVQLATLKELSSRLIDVHSQNQSALVGDEEFRIRVIDSLAGNTSLLGEYADAYHTLHGKESELSRLRADMERNRRDEEYLRFQWQQLSSLGLRKGEIQELEAEQKELANAGAIMEALGKADGLMDADESGVLPWLRSAGESLQHISSVLDGAGELADRMQSAYIELKDIAAEISEMAGRIEDNPTRLEAVDNRLGAIYALMQRHGTENADALLDIEADLRTRLEAITSADDDIAALEKEIITLREKAEAVAARLTESRTKAAATFDSEVCGVLSRLGMAAARFVTEITPAEALSPLGADSIRFLFDANRDGRLQPIERVASGGETSRVMLALKAAVARSTKLPTIIFDEIDTGVSGRIADAMGEIISELSGFMQVINITHLPQVASKGDTHFLVYKESSGDGAYTTRIRRLDRQQRIEEIAKMLSGSHVTDAATAQACTLLGYTKRQ